MKLARGRAEWIPTLVTLIISVLLLVGCTPAVASYSPVINSLTVESDVVSPSQTCEVACNASHLDGESLSYQWSANRGSISGEGPVVNWTAPDAAGNYTITVSVSNGKGGQSISYLSIKVVPNKPPTIESLNIKEAEVTVSEDCHVACVATDPDGDVLSYKWSASGGSIYGKGPAVNWTAPDTVGTCTITVTVTDGQGGEDTASLDVDVLAVNNPPKIKGFRITDIMGEPVGEKDIRIDKHYFIECIASDPDGDKLSYDWSVTGGTVLKEDAVVKLLADSESMLSDYMPKIQEGVIIPWLAPDDKTEATFEVTVQDGRGGEDIGGMQRQVYLSKCDAAG